MSSEANLLMFMLSIRQGLPWVCYDSVRASIVGLAGLLIGAGGYSGIQDMQENYRAGLK